MKIPSSILPLVDDGIIEEVVRPLMSGKEAQVYLVIAGGEERVAKVYKNARHRSFKHKADYTEGRRTRNSRDQRALAKRSKHGRTQDEAAWRSTEVDMIYRLRDAGVRVPEPYIYSDGVLVMEFITDEDGYPAPRLGDVDVAPDEARWVFDQLLQAVVRMLGAGVVHGDLSDFNVLLGADGPVVIDFPQAIDAASNRNARKILIRDVDNLHNFLSRSVRGYRRKPFAEEMWALYERGELEPDTRLQGDHREDTRRADVGGLLREIDFARRDAQRAGVAGAEDARDGDDASGAYDGVAGEGAGARRRRVEVVMSRPARESAGRGRAGARGSAEGRGGHGPGRSRGESDGRAGEPEASGKRRRNRRGPDVDTAALLAAQPVVTDAQAEKAAEIERAVREAQAARAARAAAAKSGGSTPNGKSAKRGRRRRRGGTAGPNGNTAPGAGTKPAPSTSTKRSNSSPPRGAGETAAAAPSGARRKRRRRRRGGKGKPSPSGSTS